MSNSTKSGVSGVSGVSNNINYGHEVVDIVTLDDGDDDDGHEEDGERPAAAVEGTIWEETAIVESWSIPKDQVLRDELVNDEMEGIDEGYYIPDYDKILDSAQGEDLPPAEDQFETKEKDPTESKAGYPCSQCGKAWVYILE